MKSVVKQNFLYNIAYQILILILPLITAPYLSRVVGSDGIGVYSYTQAFAHYFVIIAMLGVNNYGNREIARVCDDDDQRSTTFWEIYMIQLGLSIIMSSLYILYLLICQPENSLIYGLQLLYVVSATFDINWYFFGVQKFKLTVIRNALIKALTTVCIFIFVKDNKDLWLYTGIIAGGTFLSNLAVWPFLLHEVKFKKICWKNVVGRIRPDIILFIPVIAVSLYNVMDKLMLGWFCPYSEVGFYTYALRIVEVPVAVIVALGTVMMPHVSNLMARGKDKECAKLFDKAMCFVLFMSLAFAFGMANLAPIFSDWYYGEDFARCGLFMIWLTPMIVFKCWANLIRTQYIIPKSYDRVFILSVTAGAVCNLILNIILIPKLQGFGAIIGTLAAEFTVCAIQTWETAGEINFKPYFKELAVFTGIGAVMYMAMSLAKYFIGSRHPLVMLLVLFFVGVIIYVSMSYIYIIRSKRLNYLIRSHASAYEK